ncbi:unnamed protein product [Linum tenue]|uniref:Uncharacterized protein n=1 Tax=Linum tenue TaxID=586396 RepID=A0AAV0IE11_9ROSI|nr:unnamed protein product [Linum tenue]
MLLGLASIQRITSLSKLVKLKYLILTDASKLCVIESLVDLQSLQHVTIIGCTSLERLPAGLSGLEQLRSIEIQGCMKLTDLLALWNLRSNVSVWQPNSDTYLYDSDLSSDS